MEKSKLILVMAMLLASLNIQAGWRVVIDRKTTAAVVSNAASQKLIEDKHNGRLDSIKSKQEKLMKYTATMASIKELYQLSMQNITGFGGGKQILWRNRFAHSRYLQGCAHCAETTRQVAGQELCGMPQ